MRNEFVTLHLKEWAIMAALDELAVIRSTGKTDAASLQPVFSALLSYPASSEALHFTRKHYNAVADHCVAAAVNLLQLSLLGQAPAHALHTTCETLGIALGHIQTAITRYPGSK